MSEPNPPHTVSLTARLLFLSGSILLIAATVLFTPQMAQQIAYSWNIGLERARAQIAREFLAEHPYEPGRIAMVVRAVAPSVVGIQVVSTSTAEEILHGGRRVFPTNVGSGVIINAQEGHILTNEHVITDAYRILVRLSDGRETEAEVIGRDRALDLAVLRIDISPIEAISWGDSRRVSVGDQVVAIGSPYGLQQTVTSGIISATERSSQALTARSAGRTLIPITREFLQTDAAINPGNSGGPLVDMNGQIIGICTAIISIESGGNSGIGFAIPSFTAEKIYEEILAQGEVQHGWIGVLLEDVSLVEARQLNQERPLGTIVRHFVLGNSPAREAGLQRGDILLRWGDTEITNTLHLIHLITLTRPGTTETVELSRDGELLRLEITIGTRPTGSRG